MTTPTNFRNPPPPAVSKADIAARIPPAPDFWTAADDVELMEGLFRGLTLAAIADRTDHRLKDVYERWAAFKAAAGVTVGWVPMAAQLALLEIVRERATP
jgi:hypothetical protein